MPYSCLHISRWKNEKWEMGNLIAVRSHHSFKCVVIRFLIHKFAFLAEHFLIYGKGSKHWTPTHLQSHQMHFGICHDFASFFMFPDLLSIAHMFGVLCSVCFVWYMISFCVINYYCILCYIHQPQNCVTKYKKKCRNYENFQENCHLMRMA